MTTNIMAWSIEQSHMVAHPNDLETESLAELREWVQGFADSKKIRADRPAMGEISFRYEMDNSTDEVTLVHTYFTNKHGKLQRFMRLRKIVE